MYNAELDKILDAPNFYKDLPRMDPHFLISTNVIRYQNNDTIGLKSAELSKLVQKLKNPEKKTSLIL